MHDGLSTSPETESAIPVAVEDLDIETSTPPWKK